MQIRTPEEEVLFAKMFQTKEEMLEAKEVMKYEPVYGDCTFHESELPKVGDEIEINGLLFRCTNVSVKKGYIGFHIVQPDSGI